MPLLFLATSGSSYSLQPLLCPSSTVWEEEWLWGSTMCLDHLETVAARGRPSILHLLFDLPFPVSATVA